jgi:hypothetical protein
MRGITLKKKRDSGYEQDLEAYGSTMRMSSPNLKTTDVGGVQRMQVQRNLCAVRT